jgi:hypothetical protein
MSEDFEVPMPMVSEVERAMPLDEATEIACTKLGLPPIGGPSAKGWSLFSTAMKCPHLFRMTYDIRGAEGGEFRVPAAPLQIGGGYHSLQGYYYGFGLSDGDGMVGVHDRGLCRTEYLEPLLGKRKAKFAVTKLPPDGADQLLLEWKAMCEPLEADLVASVAAGERDGNAHLSRRPSAAVIFEAERLFDAHTSAYGSGLEVVRPLAIEWCAEHRSGYTCRYDMIGKLEEGDPLVSDMPSVLQPGSIVVYERKTSAFLSETVLDGWFLDGQILGQIMCWKGSGCEKLFGPLAAIVVDIVTKKKVPDLRRVVVPATLSTVKAHERWIDYTDAEIKMWRATRVYPQRWTACIDRYGKCGLWDQCADRATQENADAAD